MKSEVNWKALIDDLGQHGYTLNIIALSVGDSPKGLSPAADGRGEPRRPSRERLVNLWCLATGRKREEMPVTERLWR